MGKHWEDWIEELLEQWRTRLALVERRRAENVAPLHDELQLLGVIETYRVVIKELDELLK